MGRFLDLSVTVDSSTMSPPSTSMRLAVTPHNRGSGSWQDRGHRGRARALFRHSVVREGFCRER